MAGFLQTPILGRKILDYLIAVTILVATILVLEILRRALIRRDSHHADVTGEATDQQKLGAPFFLTLARRFVIPGLYIGAFYVAIRVLAPPEQYAVAIRSIFIVLITWLVVRFLVVAASSAFKHYVEGGDGGTNRLRPLIAILNIAIWAVGVVFLLDNLGFKISTVIAGIGIGGIAVALAAQAVLGDLFSYFVILLDRPFELGDFLIFDDVLGSIEKIGLKTTRIRSLSGEQIIVANSILTGSRVRNYKRMERRRIVFTIGVTYDTGSKLLRQIPEIIRAAIESDPRTQFDRAHFAKYGDSSLDFEVVYYVLSAEYNHYMDIQQQVNLDLYERFEELGIEFAFPTRTLVIAGDAAGRLKSTGS
ncbi:MAG TPA: mechanosensitive ion channel family protein [Spirochaetia bacterium]|nr:mechanosensitive ion channel family protein [Spirochaetia bacterium]